MKTPRPGDQLRVIDPEAMGTDPIVEVVAVFKSLDEDWGDDGPTAWELRDELERLGKTSDWFAIVHDVGDDLITTCLMSFEAELVE